MTSVDLNYPKELIVICQANKTKLRKVDIEAVLKATSNFPSDISVTKRVYAIRKNLLCVCKQCGVCHGDHKKLNYCNFACYDVARKIASEENKPATVERERAERKINYAKNRDELLKQKIVKSIEKYNGVENEDYVECKICGLRTTGNLSTHVIRVHNTTATEYKENFNARVTTINHGFRKGEENIAFNHGGKFSPWSEKFINPNNIDIDECKARAKNAVNESGKRNSTIEFYLNQGMSEDDAKLELSKRQTTFSLEKCIEKYGETEGINIFNARQEKWQKTLSDKPADEIKEINRKKHYKNGNGSKFESEIFNAVKEKFDDAKTQMPIYYDDGKRWYFYDINVGNKIIECNGDFWHANPEKYEPHFVFKHYHLKGKTSKDIWDLDKAKTDFAKSVGYEVLTIWELEYKKDKTGTIDKIEKFISG